MADKIKIALEQYHGMIEILKQRPTDMFLSAACRRFYAQSEMQLRGGEPAIFDRPSDAVMPGTVAHNRIQIDDKTFASSARSARLINPLTALDDVFAHAASRKVLSIGPRTVMEILHLIGVGFLPKNITAIDLISTSPLIDTGDMHALPYPDGSFDIVISGWVLAYSKDPQKAADEMLRVVADRGLVAIGATYNSEAAELEYKGADEKIQGTVFRRVSDIQKLLRGKLSKIYFQYEPEGDASGVVILVGRIRH